MIFCARSIAAERTLIRTEADELTYNLHVMIRFDLELQMLDGRLSIADLPDAWNARYLSDLGVQVPDVNHGCLQDVHWFGGAIGGAFQCYTLGNILSAQFFEAATRAHPYIYDEMERGEFGTLRDWLVGNLYRFRPRARSATIGRKRDRRPAANQTVYGLSARQI